MAIKIKRIYDDVEKSDGYRVLVDRLWPRGIKKENAHIDLWMKDVAPSTALRKWFDHDPEKWNRFLSDYRRELKDSDALKALLSIMKKHKTITLLYSAKDEKFNQAIALQHIIINK